jgi:carbonic anhydrase
MTPIEEEILSANGAYARAFGDRGRLAMPPARHFAILTCMDARLDPARYAGLKEGDAHVIRNAGGRVTEDAIRSLVISHKLLGTNEWFVIHHTNCGMETFTDGVMRSLLERSLDTAELGPSGWRDVGKTPGSTEGEFIDWLTIDDQERSVLQDVRRLRDHPLVPRYIPIHGYVYDVTTGQLREIGAATSAGRAEPERRAARRAPSMASARTARKPKR